jgi:molybdopterin synthase sulfur carrier subunit
LIGVQIVYFAAVREALGRDGEVFVAVVGVSSIAQLLDHLEARDPSYVRAFADRGKLRFALDQKMVKIDAALGEAKELAIFPPVTGG